MSVNKSALNDAPVNGQEATPSKSVNTFAINSIPVNGGAAGAALSIEGEGSLISIEQIVRLQVASGSLISIEQTVGFIGSGSLISIEQIVGLRLSSTVAESIASIEQGVRATYTGSATPIEQRVIDSSVPSHLDRTGWDLTLSIGGLVIPNSQIHGNIEIDRTENDAALMRITLMPETGVQDVELYHGKVILLDIHTASGTNRIYTGTVDIPEIDLIEEKITLRCTDKRTELLNSQLAGITDTIGVYSPHIFRVPKDTAEEVEQRLTTTPFAVDFDAYGNYTITSWFAKSTADFTLTDSDVYRNRPRVELASRGRVTNQVNINFGYRYERFHHATRTWEWESPINTTVCLLLQFGYSLTFRSAIQAAIEGAGWPLKENVTYDAIPASGWYSCSGVPIAWSTTQLQGVNEPVLDSEGNQLNDTDGNPLFKARITGGTDFGPLYAAGAMWEGTTQWAQTVTEDYTLTLNAPQSQTQFGVITQDLTYAMESEADTAGWEDYTSFRTVAGQGDNYNIDQDLNRNESNQAIDVALQQAKNVILGSHRDTRVKVDTFIWPEIDLKHTVLVDTTELDAKGKVFNINHRLNIGTGEARTRTTLVLFRSQGSASDSILSIPAQPTDVVTYNTQNILLGNHFAEDPTTEEALSWNGMIGNAWITEAGNTFRTTFQEQFIVDAPAVPDELRTAKDLSTTDSYTVAIPNDTLVISFDGKS